MAAVAYPKPGTDHRGGRPVGGATGGRAVPPRRTRPGSLDARRPAPRRQRAARRRALVLAGALAVLALWAVARTWAGPQPDASAWPAPAAPAPVGAGAPHTYVVQPGDTLWAIARRFQPTGDVRPLVARLARANGGATVVAGQRVVLPP